MSSQHGFLSTHILDISLGVAAADVTVELEFQHTQTEWKTLNKTSTNAEGRVKNLLPTETNLKAGIYRLTFSTGEYFSKTQRACFFPTASVVFQVTDSHQHYHIPLLLSPFGYSTYRGT